MNQMSKSRIASLFVVLLKTARVLVAVVIIGAACLFTASLFDDLSTAQLSLPVSFHAEPQALRVSVTHAGGGPLRIESVGGHGNLAFRPPSRAFLAATGVSVLIGLGLVLWLIQQLLAVFETLRRGRPFVAANAVRVRHLAYVIIGSEVVRFALEFAWNRFATTHFAVDGWHFDSFPDVDVTTILAGLVVLAISEVFRAGTALDEDQSLTV